MKLTGGEARGRRLKGPRGPGLRPTSDRVREALFDILAAKVEGAHFLDAFAGTGAVGLEALSRGAARAVFAERDRRAVRLIEANLALCGWQARGEIVAGEIERTVGVLAKRAARFGVIFLDPPYASELTESLLSGLAALLLPSGTLVLEHRSARELKFPTEVGLTPIRTYRYGDTSLTLSSCEDSPA